MVMKDNILKISIYAIVVSLVLTLFGAWVMANKNSSSPFMQLMNRDAYIVLQDIRCGLTAGLSCRK